MASDEITAESYSWARYVSKPRWASYWHQITEILSSEAKTCLVIGKGDGVVGTVLRHHGVAVTTCDLREILGPDAVTDVRALGFRDAAFDAVLCAQVLEHLEFRELDRCLSELGRVAKRRLLVTLPDSGRYLEVALRLPRVGLRRFVARLPYRSRRIDPGHRWEINARDFPSLEFDATLNGRFVRRSEYNVPENRYHRFFVLDLPAETVLTAETRQGAQI